MSRNGKGDAHLVNGKYSIEDLVDLNQLKALFEKFTDATGFTIGFLNHPAMEVLISSGWRDICTKFHRSCPASAAICIKSNRHLLDRLDIPGRLIVEECENGMVDCATPIIIEGKHVASLATGQLLLEKPGLERFRKQAERFGFDEEEYLKALAEIPIVDAEKLKTVTRFLGDLAQMISQLGYTKLMVMEDAKWMKVEITERKRAEEALRDSEAFRKRVFDSSKLPIVIMDAKTFKYIDCNPSAAEVCRCASREELLGKTPMDFSAPLQYDGTPSLKKARFYIEKAMSEGTAVFEWLHQRPDGELWDGEVHLVSFQSGERQLLQFIVQDITERKRVEGQLKMQSRFQELLMKMSANYIKLPLESVDGAIHASLGELAEFFKADKAFIFSYDFERGSASATHEWSRPGTESVMDKFQGLPLSEIPDWDVEAHRHGKPIWMPDAASMPPGNMQSRLLRDGVKSLLTVPLMDAEACLGFVGFTWLSSHYALSGNEQSLLTVFANLLVNVRKRKASELERAKLEDQFQQAQKMEAVGRLAGGVAHDFNNMLQAIMGYLFLIEDEIPKGSALYENLQEIQKATEKSADLTRQLLAFARKQAVSPKELDLNETVEGMLKMLRRLIGENIDISWIPGPGCCRVKMDPSQIDQILANLCVNARDAIEGNGKVTIETGLESFDAESCANRPGFLPGDYVRLVVSDDGCGMGKEVKDRLFEPFFTTKDTGKGTGLGLAMVYGIVKQNDGFINVYSEPGRGSSFNIYLPLLPSASKGQGGERPPAPPASNGDETILLVEDEKMLLKMAKSVLESFGYKVLAASAPDEALSIARESKGRIHLLVSDVVMPKMNGGTLAAKISEMRPDVKCLFMSGYTSNVIASHGILDESVEFIQKPFPLPALAIKVREVLDRK